jgi:N-acetylglucosaminyldiphosphoundecaprenol N-acetyl-beta-D-mannosaminyltransferase
MPGHAEEALTAGRRTGSVLGVPIDALKNEEAIGRIMCWARDRESRYVTICNAHVVVTASREPVYREVIAGSDMATPDGAPVAWMLRRQGFAGQHRVSGPDLMWDLLDQCQRNSVPVYFYGSTPEILQRLEHRLLASFPGLRIAGTASPPFRPLSAMEDTADVAAINASEAGIVFVGLGCPKQERWMAAHRGRVQAVMIGVGAAFDFHAGTISRAPEWMRSNGLEWLHRFASEPKRLWRRYLVTNTLFIVGATWQLLTGQKVEENSWQKE